MEEFTLRNALAVVGAEFVHKWTGKELDVRTELETDCWATEAEREAMERVDRLKDRATEIDKARAERGDRKARASRRLAAEERLAEILSLLPDGTATIRSGVTDQTEDVSAHLWQGGKWLGADFWWSAENAHGALREWADSPAYAKSTDPRLLSSDRWEQAFRIKGQVLVAKAALEDGLRSSSLRLRNRPEWLDVAAAAWVIVSISDIPADKLGHSEISDLGGFVELSAMVRSGHVAMLGRPVAGDDRRMVSVPASELNNGPQIHPVEHCLADDSGVQFFAELCVLKSDLISALAAMDDASKKGGREVTRLEIEEWVSKFHSKHKAMNGRRPNQETVRQEGRKEFGYGHSAEIDRAHSGQPNLKVGRPMGSTKKPTSTCS
jgi:hypothetical protein